MYKALNCNAIGIKGLTLPDTIALARATGFAGVDFDIRQAMAQPDAFVGTGIRPAQWGLPVAPVLSGDQNTPRFTATATAPDAIRSRRPSRAGAM